MNRYFQLCDNAHKRLAVGGGGSEFGLCVEQDFQTGSTGRCHTFNNDPLCDQETFDRHKLLSFGKSVLRICGDSKICLYKRNISPVFWY